MFVSGAPGGFWVAVRRLNYEGGLVVGLSGYAP